MNDDPSEVDVLYAKVQDKSDWFVSGFFSWLGIFNHVYNFRSIQDIVIIDINKWERDLHSDYYVEYKGHRKILSDI